MSKQTTGIHHITAIAKDPQQNIDFYAGVLGLRLVKKTVNFDAPEVYHFYFGNEAGHPGTIMTFFPWPDAVPGRIGGGQVGYTTFVVPHGSLGFWEARLEKFSIAIERIERFGEQYLRFKDAAGLQLELVEREEGARSGWAFGGVPVEHAIKGFGGGILFSTAPKKTEAVLEQVLGLQSMEENEEYIRFRGTAELGSIVDLKREAVPRGNMGAGTVHHIAWRAKDDQDQAEWSQWVRSQGQAPTPVQDRNYFNAIYFREAGSILFEIATDPPGFAVDEPYEQLGEALKLPAQYEKYRAQIEDIVQPVAVRVLEEDQS
ncbi:ring-cleaving dioxygenase [Paenibacillus aquistagni]|uniref:Glyoxalase family protein n=1 Tax=Paenibacillus aquistagni TaxID=1852522 RepID=A0A1X7KRL8_9BACL|nr:ring-cleaving dioxygenase [Paenibacillus aquistagni]SMG43861.1 glyoxalase family protein [Paenibacillus aquistagni]